MRIRAVLSLVVACLAVVALVGTTSTAGAGRAGCAQLAGNGGYTYAGHQASRTGHGVRATIAATRTPSVEAGHVAAWIGLGGPGQGPNGTDMWIQVGLATMHGWNGTVLYAEVTKPGREPAFRLLEENVPVGASRRVAVLEMGRRPNWWRIWVNGEPVTEPIHLPGSSERWAPIATAESWNGGASACNGFAFRFERVSVSHGRGGSWFVFTPGYDFLDANYQLRALSRGEVDRTLSHRFAGGAPAPYAFLAASS